MTDTNPTIKQHYVPRFYLKNFANQQGILQTFDIKNNRMGSPKHYSSVGYTNYFYAVKTGVPDDISQEVEKWLQGFENFIASEMPRIIDKISNNDHIDRDDRYVLSVLMSLLWLRSPNMREQLNKMEEDLMKKVISLRATENIDSFFKKSEGKMPDEQKEKFIKMLKEGSYKVEFNNAQHIQFMMETLGFNSPGFTNMFFGQKWKIYIAKGDKRFITSDSPLAEWWQPPKDFWGNASFPERNKYFPLTPEIFLELTFPIGSTKAKRKTIFKNEDNIVDLFNILIAVKSHGFAYSNNKELLEKIKNGRDNPGKLEMMYHKRFELPWRKYEEERKRQKEIAKEKRKTLKKNNN